MLENLDWNLFASADLKLSARPSAPVEHLSELSSGLSDCDEALVQVIYLTVVLNVCKAPVVYGRRGAS